MRHPRADLPARDVAAGPPCRCPGGQVSSRRGGREDARARVARPGRAPGPPGRGARLARAGPGRGVSDAVGPLALLRLRGRAVLRRGRALEAVEAALDPAAQVARAAREVADQLHQRILGGLHVARVARRGLAEGVAEGGVLVLVPPRVVAVHDPLVVPRFGPPLQLGRPHGGERVRAGQHVEDLQHGIAQITPGVVLLRLLQERVHVHLVQMVAARDLHQAAHRGPYVLAHQQPGPVGGQLRLAEPLPQRRDEPHDRQIAQRDPRHLQRQAGQEEQDRAVHRVAGQRVAHLVPDDRPHLLLVQELHQPRGDHDDRLVQADAHRVRLRVLRDVHRRDLRQVQDVAGVQQHVVQMTELPLGDPHRVGQEQQPEAPLRQQPAERLEHLVEAAELAQRHQCGAVRRMLVRTRGDPREARPLPAGHPLVPALPIAVVHVFPQLRPRVPCPRGGTQPRRRYRGRADSRRSPRHGAPPRSRPADRGRSERRPAARGRRREPAPHRAGRDDPGLRADRLVPAARLQAEGRLTPAGSSLPGSWRPPGGPQRRSRRDRRRTARIR
ncbi:hypothetical protein SGPA1_30498 [Streptomyces misionensis JCM 4497]